VLDAGCGTGNYAAELLQYGCGYVTLLDASPGMLEKAREKMAQQIQSGRVKEVIEAKLPAIPYPDQTFDAVMFNLVLVYIILSCVVMNFCNEYACSMLYTN